MRLRTLAVVTMTTAIMVPALATAQVQAPPPRENRGTLGGGRPVDSTRQTLVLDGNLTSGYDDSLTPPGGASGLSALTPYPSSYTIFGAANLRYRIGGEARALEVTGGGHTQRYANVPVPSSYGGDLNARGHLSIARRARLNLGQDIRWVPNFNPGLFVRPQGTAGGSNPNTNPANGVGAQRSMNWASSATLTYDWTRRTRTDAGYSFDQHRVANTTGFNSETHVARIGFDRSVGRFSGITARASRSASRLTRVDRSVRPLEILTANIGWRLQRNVSRSRSISLAAGGGTSIIDTFDYFTGEPLEYRSPSIYGNAAIDVGRSWNVSADYLRSVQTLQGLNPEAFVTHSTSVSAGGFSGRRVEVVLSAGYATGHLGGATTGAGHLGRYEAYTGTGQLRFRVSRQLSAVAVFNHYRYLLDQAAQQTIGTSPNVQRNSVRAGLSWTLPIIDTRR